MAPSICGVVCGGVVCEGVKGCIWGGGGSKEVNVLDDCMKLLVSALAGAVGDLNVR